jgi:dephospho-CoA kinase
MKNQNCKKRVVLGLTGSIGCGKSTVARIFKSFGARIIDADKIAHGLMRPKKAVYKKIVSIFGKKILKPDGYIDRSKLGNIVFNNMVALSQLNGIAHPEIIRAISVKIKSFSKGIIVLDAPLLIETGLINCADKVVVVKVNLKTQLERLESKFKLNGKDILKRIRSQIPLREKIKLGDFIIDNNGSIGETKKQVAKIRRKVWKS